MATRGTGAISKVSSSRLTTRGKLDKENKQRTLDLGLKLDERKDRELEKKKVSFKDSERSEEEIQEMDKIRSECREFINKEMCEFWKEKKKLTNMLEEMKKKEKNWEVRIRILEEKVEENNNEIKELKEVIEKLRQDDTGEAEGSIDKDRWSIRSRGSVRKDNSSWGGSVYTDISEDRLSFREVGKLKKWIVDKEKEERRNNIVIKGMRITGGENCRGEVLKGHVTRMLEEKLDLRDKDCKIETCRWSGNVIIAKIRSEEEKKEVMKRKNKLKGGQLYIENDLTWEERQIQSMLNKWAKSEKNKNVDIKIGMGKARINGVWKFWGEIEKEVRREVGKEIEEGGKEIEERRKELDEAGVKVIEERKEDRQDRKNNSDKDRWEEIDSENKENFD